MSVINAKWKEEQCRVEYGIFFTNDECILLGGNPEDGYIASTRILVSTLIENDANGWAHLNPNLSCYIKKNGLIVLAGGTSWEGDGFVALLEAKSNELVWIMHLYQSEKFVEVGFDGESILAVSAEYPLNYRWKIPLYNPAMFERIP